MRFYLKDVHPSAEPVIEILEDAMDCDAVILMGWKDGSLYLTQSRGDMTETLATLDFAREFLSGMLINTSGTLH